MARRPTDELLCSCLGSGMLGTATFDYGPAVGFPMRICFGALCPKTHGVIDVDSY
jgi:hypothetical protein